MSRKYGGTTIDKLNYSYTGNKLNYVDDAAINTGMGFTESSNILSTEYTYGNMLTDLNTGISNIDYNLLNLPTTIVKGGNTVQYIYSAMGEKLQTILPGKTITYNGGFVYEDGALQYILNEEGRYSVNGINSGYEYNLKDHLGNGRMVINSSGDDVQTNNYYPFGGIFAQYSSSSNKYKFNGKELQEETDWLDYGFRMYDNRIGRWMCQDPMAEKAHNISHSPYNYCVNNPVNYIDPDGQDWFYCEEGKDRLYLYLDGVERWMDYDKKLYGNFWEWYSGDKDLNIMGQNISYENIPSGQRYKFGDTYAIKSQTFNKLVRQELEYKVLSYVFGGSDARSEGPIKDGDVVGWGFSYGGTASLIGGGGVKTFVIFDRHGGVEQFNMPFAAIGVDLSYEVNKVTIKSVDGKDFKVGDFGGHSASTNASLLFFNFSRTDTKNFTVIERGGCIGILPVSAGVSWGTAYSVTGLPLPGQYCFGEGTLVYTPHGYRDIANLEVGDVVYGFDHEANCIKECKVKVNYSRKVSDFLKVRLGAEEVTVTENHPFFVEDKGYIEIGKLQEGDEVFSISQKSIYLSYKEQVNEEVRVYNLTVEDCHNFIIGRGMILVHNKY